MEEEVRRILAAALPYVENPPEGLGTAIHALFKPVALTDEEYAIFASAFERSDACTCSFHFEGTSSNTTGNCPSTGTQPKNMQL